MSSNNFYRVLQVGERYAVEMGWMEEDTGLATTPGDDAVWFDTLKDAVEYAASEYSEYGVFYEGESTNDVGG